MLARIAKHRSQIPRDKIVTEAQERLLGPQGKLHPAEYTITELALVETTDDDPAKVRRPRDFGFCASGFPPLGFLLWRFWVLRGHE